MGPLSISIATDQAKTSVPMFAPDQYIPMRLTAIEQGHVEGKGDTIKFTWELINPAPSVASVRGEGDPIEPGKFGSKFFDTVRLYDKNTPAGQVPEMAQKAICQRQDALLGTGDAGNKAGKPTRPPFNGETAPELFGKVAHIKFKVKTGEYEGNEIAGLRFPGDEKA